MRGDVHLLTVRPALVLLLGVVTSGTGGALAALGGGSLTEALLYGGAAAGVGIGFFNRLIAPDRAPVTAEVEHGARDKEQARG